MYPTEVIVDYSVLRENFRAIQSYSPKDNLVPVIKSDAYGHGLVKTAHAFMEGGAQRLAVFRVEEALALREAGIVCPIWVLLGALDAEFESAFGKNFTLVCYCREQLAQIMDKIAETGLRQDFLLALDTGMGRLGFLPHELPKVLEHLAEKDKLHCLRGLISHVAKAADPQFHVTQLQVQSFRDAVKLLPDYCEASNLCASNAWLNKLLPELNYARPGICLYEQTFVPGKKEPITQDAMTVKTRLVSVKDMPAGSTISYNCICTLKRDSRIAVAPLGYEDGYSRALSNKGFALVRGKRAPLCGTVCMSMIMLDVTDIPDVKAGEEAVFLGRQGEDEITIRQLAQLANTTEHELLCAFGKHRQD